MNDTIEVKYHDKIFRFFGKLDEHLILREMRRTHCFYELDLLESMTRLNLNQTGVSIDVGANIGNHSVFLGSYVSDYVLAVEPNPTICPLLRENLKTNLENFYIVECALGRDHSKGTIIMDQGAHVNHGMARIEVGGGDIPIHTLDDVVKRWRTNTGRTEAINLIKVDVEGMELDVLKGAREVIMQYRPELFIETATPLHFKQITAYLKTLNYRPLRKYASTPVFHYSYKPNILAMLDALVRRAFERIKYIVKR